MSRSAQIVCAVSLACYDSYVLKFQRPVGTVPQVRGTESSITLLCIHSHGWKLERQSPLNIW